MSGIKWLGLLRNLGCGIAVRQDWNVREVPAGCQENSLSPRLLKTVQMRGGKRSVSGGIPLETPESPARLGRRPEPVELGLRKTRHSERGSVVALGRPVEI